MKLLVSSCSKLQSNEYMLDRIRSMYTEILNGKRFGRSEWINTKDVHLYYRATKTVVNRAYVNSIVVSNVEIKNKGKGIYSALLDSLYAMLKTGDALYIENVLDPAQYPIYERRGFLKIGDASSLTQSFYKLKH